MLSMVSVSLLVDRDEGLGDRRKLDWDMWIGREEVVHAPDHMHVLSFGAASLGQVMRLEGVKVKGSTSLNYRDGKQHSPTMRVTPGLPDDVDRLVRDELVPWLRTQPAKPVLTVSSGSTNSWGSSYVALTSRLDAVQGVPFVLDANDRVLAGAFRRYSSPREAWVWVLPHVPDRPELWLAAAMRDWHERTPQAVPQARPWQQREDWLTEEELAAARAMADLELRRARWSALYAARRQALDARELAATSSAASGLRRLLLAHDDDLVDAVAVALRFLGFEVANEDDARAEGLGKAHDLNVIDPDVPDRRVIAEVKGFTKGGRSSALGQANQHILRFAVASGGTPPDACWVIVNHFRDHDPDERPELLQGADEDIAIFAGSGGLVIDTRDVFRLVRWVETGKLTAKAAREHLRVSTGRFTLRPLPD